MINKDRIEALLCFDGTNGIYHINGMSIFANKFEFENNFVKFYTKTLDYKNGQFGYSFTFSAFIYINDIRTIDGVVV